MLHILSVDPLLSTQNNVSLKTYQCFWKSTFEVIIIECVFLREYINWKNKQLPVLSILFVSFISFVKFRKNNTPIRYRPLPDFMPRLLSGCPVGTQFCLMETIIDSRAFSARNNCYLKFLSIASYSLLLRLFFLNISSSYNN